MLNPIKSTFFDNLMFNQKYRNNKKQRYVRV